MTTFHASTSLETPFSNAAALAEEGMQLLTAEEMDQVHGGFGPAGAVAGAIGAGVGTYLTGGNAGQIAASALFGGVAGFFGGVGLYASSAAVAAMGAYATSGSHAFSKR